MKKQKANKRYFDASEKLEKQHDKAMLDIEQFVNRIHDMVSKIEHRLFKAQEAWYSDQARRIEKLWDK